MLLVGSRSSSHSPTYRVLMRVFLFLLASCSRFPFQGNLVGSRSSSHSPTYRVLMRVFLFLLASCSRFPFQGNLVGSSGLEPPTSRLSGARSSLLSYEPVSFPVVLPVSCPSLFGGDDGIRTHDPLLAGQVLSQLSYTPVWSPYKPHFFHYRSFKIEQQLRTLLLSAALRVICRCSSP